MKHIYIKPTEECNLSCQHCYLNKTRQDDYFDVNAVINYLQKYKDEQVTVHFHGGEPFLAKTKHLKKICKAFPNWQYVLTSNLTLPLTDKKIKFIKKYLKNENNISFIKTSWDYKIRFKDSIQEGMWRFNIERLSNKGIEISIIVCLSKYLLSLTPKEFLAIIDPLPVQEIIFERLSHNTTPPNLIPKHSEIENWLCELYPLTIHNNKRFEFFENLNYACQGIYLGCRNASCMIDVITINPDGSIGTCPNISNIHIANIYNTSNKDYDINYKNYKDMERFKNECLACEYFTICHGGGCCQQFWQDRECPGMKKLLKMVLDFNKGNNK